ncbi:pneumococcal serine-rich repeat protein-like isoform X2 [Wyeomyia smithii]|uniref:pneumococcal serine-rich repeat protein-like isoform X2 n=1 Tax=Wyeomyia smithii TaxID=174621 RepID=UPI0024680C44|nr:pneumococcal serine-rich repeat protein-like isoform X2 [Wyeomyia smithii]
MLKIGFLIVLIVGSCLADVTSWNDDPAGHSLSDKHFSQHDASVNAARRGAAERLARISSSGSAGAPCGSTICYRSSGFSDNSDAETLGQGVVGFSSGSTGASSSSSKYQASSQHESVQSAVPVYPVISGGKSSYASSSQRHSASSVSAGQPLNYVAGTDGIKTRSNFAASSGSSIIQPIIASAYPIGQGVSHDSFSAANRDISAGVYAVPVDVSNAHRTRSSFATASERESSSVVQPVPVYSAGEQASKYVASGRQSGYQRLTPSNTYVVYGKPIPVYSAVGSNLESSARFANSDGAVYTPVQVYPVRTSSQHSSMNEQQQQSYTSTATTPRPLYVSSSDQSSQTGSNYRASSSYRPIYQPVYTNRLSTSNKEEEDEYEENTGQSVVPIIAAPVVSSSSQQHEERHEDYSRRGSTYTPVSANTGSAASQYAGYDQRRTAYVPVVGGSTTSAASQYSSQDRRQEQRASFVPVAPSAVSSSSASKYSAHEHRQQQGQAYVPVVPVGEAASSSASRYSAQERHQQQLAGGSYYPVGGTSQGSRYSASEAASAFNQQQQVRGGGFVPYPITNDALGQRFGSGGYTLGDNNDLGELMSESERLARLQAKNAYNGAVSGSSAIDTANRFADGDGGSSAGVDTSSGAFKRTKSWSSSSKWASGQKYDDAGKIKSYSSLSTAESEQHNIDGKKTGYKAATTTLDDDGKVSTYSLHTP